MTMGCKASEANPKCRRCSRCAPEFVPSGSKLVVGDEVRCRAGFNMLDAERVARCQLFERKDGE